MPNTNQTPLDTQNEAESIARAKLGQWVVCYSLIVVGALAAFAIWVSVKGQASIDKQYEQVKEILTIVLPVLGTWVGTILAFYFARENFVAAATQTANLIKQLTPDQRLQSISVIDVMLDMTATTTKKLVLTTPDEMAKTKLKADIVDAILDKEKCNRLPILDNAGKILYVLHRSFIDKFLVKQAEAGIKLADITLADLLNNPELKVVFESFAVVSKDAKLLVVKQMMDGNPNCSDVFVTQDGTRATVAIGWITNIILQEQSIPVVT
nr:hypothetical protein [uncultured Acinetobacter sp.]